MSHPAKQADAAAAADLDAIKMDLINAVSACMVSEPRFDGSDPAAQLILEFVEEVITRDPEFVLKVALYLRQELNIRSTANTLLALAAALPECQPFLKKYYA